MVSLQISAGTYTWNKLVDVFVDGNRNPQNTIHILTGWNVFTSGITSANALRMHEFHISPSQDATGTGHKIE